MRESIAPFQRGLSVNAIRGGRWREPWGAETTAADGLAAFGEAASALGPDRRVFGLRHMSALGRRRSVSPWNEAGLHQEVSRQIGRQTDELWGSQGCVWNSCCELCCDWLFCDQPIDERNPETVLCSHKCTKWYRYRYVGIVTGRHCTWEYATSYLIRAKPRIKYISNNIWVLSVLDEDCHKIKFVQILWLVAFLTYFRIIFFSNWWFMIISRDFGRHFSEIFPLPYNFIKPSKYRFNLATEIWENCIIQR